MKFLVILICVSVNYLWKRDRNRIDDTWFIKLREYIDKTTEGLEARSELVWVLGLLLIYFVPMGVVAGLLFLSGGIFFGLLTMLIHILVLLMAFDLIHPGLLAQGYLERWNKMDLQACFLYLKEDLRCGPVPEDFIGLHKTFCRVYIYRCFEKMFVMFFWYVLAGPLGLMFAYVCYQHRDGDMRQRNGKETGIVSKLIEMLEWIPVRLLGFTMSLVGDFESCFYRLRRTGLINELATDTTIYEYSFCALGLSSTDSTAQKPEGHESAVDNSGFEQFKEQGALEVSALQSLMERSQISWLCLMALITVLGLGV